MSRTGPKSESSLISSEPLPSAVDGATHAIIDINGVARHLLEAAPDGVILSGRDGRILFANAACETILGYDPKALVGQPIEALVPESVRGTHPERRAQFFDTPKKRAMGIGLDLMARRQDGTLCPVEISLSPLRLGDDTLAIAIIRDVTELRRLDRELLRHNEELKRSNADLEHFAYVASHDLQEPLRVVGGYTQLLAQRYGAQLDSQAHDYLNFARGGVARMQHLIQDLLDYSRLARAPRVKTMVDLNEVLRITLENLHQAIHESGAKVEVSPLPVVPGSPGQLGQLLQNLLSNALKFHQPGSPPHVMVRGRRHESQVHIEVEDRGIGIDPAHHERIFGAFQRLHTSEEYPGTGIGLAICQRIIDLHGGSLQVESSVGQGSVFRITLPLSAAVT